MNTKCDMEKNNVLIYEEKRHQDLSDLLVSVNASIEKQIEGIKKEVDMFTDFLSEIKKESNKNDEDE
jgi:hypothetical protein